MKDEVQELLAQAGQRPGNASFEEFNPLENLPTATIGKDIQPGMVITGTFMRTERATSAKFKFATEKDPVSGLPVQYIHVLKLANGSELGIWSVGELKAVFDKLPVGDLIEITYTGKGENAKGQQQHFFEYKRGAVKQ